MRAGRNDPCPCGSGKKYKRCCGEALAAAPGPAAILSAQEIGALVAMIGEDRLAEAEYAARVLLKSNPTQGILWKILSVALLRQDKDALSALRKAAELMPEDAEALINLGAVLHDRQEWSEALAHLQRALVIQPHNAKALIDAANAMRALGRPGESVALYQRALEVEPRSAEARNNLGNAFLELGLLPDAVRSYRLTLEMKADDAQVLCNLGNALRQLGQLHEAIACSRRAIALDPALSIAYNNLGLSLAGLGEREPAVASYRQALALNPSYVEALNNLGAALRDLGNRREALSLYRRAVELDPQRPESLCNLGNLLFECRRINEAEDALRRALVLQPGYSLAHLSLGPVLRMQGRAAEAEASCKVVLAADPNRVEALALLGELRCDRGRFTEAQHLFERVLAIDPGFSPAICSIAAHRKMTDADTAWLKRAEAALAKPLPLAHEINLRYALGKYFDDLGQYDEAFGNYRQANELTKRYGAKYDRAKLGARVDELVSTFDAAFVREPHAGASATELPVFIIGMPRSGTSLTEQILASHPAAFGAGEVAYWNTAFVAYQKAGPRGGAAANLIPGMAREYLARLTAMCSGVARVVDKMPANFLYAGLIHAVFPQARIIHMQRHPLDVCLSIYFQDFFNMGPYANDLEDLAHYYGEYVRITDHWRAVLPATTLLEVPYEALIEDQEGWTRRMLEFIGLPWNPQCLEFHQTERVVITASRWQVRQKINAASAGRWRKYEKFIGPLQRSINLHASG